MQHDTDSTMAGEWGWRLRIVVALTALTLLLVAVSLAIEADPVFMAASHAPLLVFYVFAFRSPVSSLLAAIGLFAATSWAWLYAASVEHADERAFVPLSHWLLWLGALVGAGLLGAALRGRRARRHPS